MITNVYDLDATDRAIILATQAGLPLVPEPYAVVAADVGIPLDDLFRRLRRMIAAGAIRRIAAVPNHFALGYRANGMSVWDVADDRVDELGMRVGALSFVTHCYRRPRHRPMWPYNLFAMVHGPTRLSVAAHVQAIAELLGSACAGHDILFSKRVLKKTGMRIVDRAAAPPS